MRGALRQHRLDDSRQLVSMRIAIRRRRIARVGAQFRQPDHDAEGIPLRRSNDRDAEPAMLGCEVADRKAASETVDADPWPREARFKRQPGIEFADLQQRLEGAHREAPRAGRVAIQARKRRNKSAMCGNDADLAVARQHRRAFDRADELHDACKTATHRIRDMVVAIQPMLAEPRDCGDRQSRIVAPQIVMIEL